MTVFRDLKKVWVIWEDRTREGDTYLTITLDNGRRLTAFRNQDRQTERGPDYIVYEKG